jgi:serine/threonine protein kinase
MSKLPASLAETEALPLLEGFEFLECQTQTALLEVWKARDPKELLKSVKIITGMARQHVLTDEELKLASHLKFIRHPSLVPIEAIEIDQGRFIVVAPFAEATLRDRYRSCLLKGKPGVPREELLEILRIAAEAIDYLDRQEGLHHLSLTPDSIAFWGNKCFLTDFGLVELAWLPAGQPLDPHHLRYAAPEVFDNEFTTASDQYSLAIIFSEMLTGHLPNRGTSLKQIRENRATGHLDLQLLPVRDQRALVRAMAPDPHARFASCTEFMDELAAGTPREGQKLIEKYFPFYTPGRTGPEAAVPFVSRFTPEDVERTVNHLVQRAAFNTVVTDDGAIRYQYDDKGSLLHKCAAWLPSDMVAHKLAPFAQQWKAKIMKSPDPDSLVLHIDLPRNLWQMLVRGGREVLEITLQLSPNRHTESKLTEVQIQISYLGRHTQDGRDAVKKMGPSLIYSLRTYLLATAEHRSKERYPFEHPLVVVPIYNGNLPGEPLHCRGKDISRQGIGILSPVKLVTRDIEIQVQTKELGMLEVPAIVLRTTQLADDQFEIGARFNLTPNAPQVPSL